MAVLRTAIATLRTGSVAVRAATHYRIVNAPRSETSAAREEICAATIAEGTEAVSATVVVLATVAVSVTEAIVAASAIVVVSVIAAVSAIEAIALV